MEKGNYNTKQKQMILKYLKEKKKSGISSMDILDYLKEKNEKVGLTTIYRYLNFLEKEDLVRVETRDGTKFYEYIEDECKSHYHLKCEKCGKMKHIDCKEINCFNKHIEESHGFILSNKNVIYGICHSCLKKEGV